MAARASISASCPTAWKSRCARRAAAAWTLATTGTLGGSGFLLRRLGLLRAGAPPAAGLVLGELGLVDDQGGRAARAPRLVADHGDLDAGLRGGALLFHRCFSSCGPGGPGCAWLSQAR